MRTGLIAATLVAIVVGGSALLLKKDAPMGSGGGTQAQSGSFKPVTKVAIKDFKYLPPSDQVKVGQSITFSNGDTAKHTATSQPQGAFDSGDLEKGKPKPVKFTKAGTYNYYCVYHAFMKGKVKVVK